LALEKVVEPSSTNLGFKVFNQKSNFPRADFVYKPESERENLELLSKKYISDKEIS
jgi:hypothetical protein